MALRIAAAPQPGLAPGRRIAGFSGTAGPSSRSTSLVQDADRGRGEVRADAAHAAADPDRLLVEIYVIDPDRDYEDVFAD